MLYSRTEGTFNWEPTPLQVFTGSNNLTADNDLNEGKKAAGGWGMREADRVCFGFFLGFFSFLLVLPSRLFPKFNPETRQVLGRRRSEWSRAGEREEP